MGFREAESWDAKAAAEFEKLVIFKSHLLQHIFKCTKAELFWKKGNYIIAEENAMPTTSQTHERLSHLFVMY